MHTPTRYHSRYFVQVKHETTYLKQQYTAVYCCFRYVVSCLTCTKYLEWYLVGVCIKVCLLCYVLQIFDGMKIDFILLATFLDDFWWWDILIWIQAKGPFKNYVDKILDFFDHLHPVLTFSMVWTLTKIGNFGPPTSSCKRSLWTPPNSYDFTKTRHILD